MQIHYFVKDLPQWAETRHVVFRTFNNEIAKLASLLSNCCYLIRYESLEILRLLIDSDTSIKDIVAYKCMTELRSQGNIFHDKPFYPLACQKLAGLATSNEISHFITELLNHPLSEVRLEVLKRLDCVDIALPTEIWPTLKHIIADEKESMECRIKALALADRIGGFDMDQLKWMLQLYRESTDDSYCCSALGAAGRIIQSSNSRDLDLITKWSEYLVESMSSASPFRQMAVESIKKCSEMLKIDGSLAASTEHGSLLSNLWICLLNCLIDDEESIRSAAAAVVADCGTGNWKHSQPAVAIEKALVYLVDKIGSHCTMMVILLLFDMVVVEEEQPEGENQSFETGDSDAFLEPLPHSLLFCQFIERCVKQHVVSLSDSEILAEHLGNRWKSLESWDITTMDSLSSNRRSASVQIVNVVKLFLLTKSLRSIHLKIDYLYQCIYTWLAQLSPHWFTYSVQQLTSQDSV